MTISEQVQKDMTEAMRAREELRLSTLRMMKSALKNKEIERRGSLDDAAALQVLSTLIKQRRDSIEHFTQGARPELARKEAAEIEIIERYMPKAIGEEEIAAAVKIPAIGGAGGRKNGQRNRKTRTYSQDLISYRTSAQCCRNLARRISRPDLIADHSARVSRCP